MTEVLIRQRMGMEDAHYGGGLVDGAYLLELFGDVATELLIRRDGDEGLFRAYDEVEFLEPVYAGDYIEATGRIVESGRTSRSMEFEAHKVIRQLEDEETGAEVLDEPHLVCRASGTCVVPEERQS
ncbi:MAG: hotdog domain-containing protein [Bradymonadaceae bacterium]